VWGPDVSPIPPQKALFQLSLAALGFVGFGFFCKYALVPDRPAVPREYPFSGLVRELGGLEENKVGGCLNFLLDHSPTAAYRQERRSLKEKMNEFPMYLAATPFRIHYQLLSLSWNLQAQSV
jgi:hypothetical protein